jgi:hypothetical protein
MSKKTASNDLDFVSPLVEIIHFLLVEVFKVFCIALKFLSSLILSKLKLKVFKITPSNPVQSKNLRSSKKVKDRDHLGYSLNNKRPYPFREIEFKRHTGVIGSTGSGKTVCLRMLIENALKAGKPVIYFDPKSSLESIQVFKDMCQYYGKKLYLFSDRDPYATSFNPLLDGDLDEISDQLINALDWSEPFYKNESIQALDEVLQCLKTSQSPITFHTIVTELNKHANKKNIKGLINQLSKVSISPYGKLLNNESHQTLTFNKLRPQNACFYIGISAMGHSSTGHILNKVFFGGLLTHAKQTLTGLVPTVIDPQEHPISIVFDELSSSVHEGFIDLLNKCREAGMEIVYATQGPSDIDRISPVLTAQIFENTNNLFIFNQIVPDHTEFFSRIIGTYKSEKRTRVIQDNEEQAMGSVRDTEEFIVHSNILRNLKVGQCILFQRIPKRVDLLNLRHWSKEQIKVPQWFLEKQRQQSVLL